jgi:TolB protein
VVRTLRTAGVCLCAYAALLAAAPAASASFPGRNGLLAFALVDPDPPGPSALYVDRPFGGPRRQILDCNSLGLCPQGNKASSSPDGSTIAFDPQLGGSIALVGFNGSNPQTISVPSVDQVASVAWSPNGRSFVLAATSDSAPNGDIFTGAIVPGGFLTRRLGFPGAGDPDWSTNNRIAVEQPLNPNNPANPNNQIVAANPDGSGRQQLTGRGGLDPSWSPHGGFLAFTRAGQIYTMRVPSRGSGRGLRRLTRRGGFNPTWSPDGRWLAFERVTRPGQISIYVMRTNGTGLRLVTRTNFFEFSQIAWQPLR